MTRRVLARSDITCSNIREAWRLHQVLWVLPVSSFDDIRDYWAEKPTGYGMSELKRVGFFRSSDDGKLLYSRTESRRSRLNSAAQQVSEGGNGSGSRKRKASSPSRRLPKRSRDWSPRREAPESSSSALQLTGRTQPSRHEASETVDTERTQTIERIEDITESE